MGRMLAIWAWAAFGHVGDIVAGSDAVVTASPDVPWSVEASFGLVVGQGDGTYRWVCHEAVTEPKSLLQPRYDQATSGEWLATVSDLEQGRGGHTIFHSPDGCAWNDVEGIDAGVLVTEVHYDPADPQRAWAVTATPDADNGVYTSADGGRTWAADLAPAADRRFHSVQAVGDEVYATATDHDGTTGAVWHRDAKGGWSESPLPDLGGAKGVRLRLLGIDEGSVYLNLDPLGADAMRVADRALEAFEAVGPVDAELLDMAIVEDGAYVALDFGNRVIRVVDGAFTEVELPPTVGLATGPSGELVISELAFIAGPLLSVREGDAFVPLAYPDDVTEPLQCPAGTEVATICEPLWAGLEPRLRGFNLPPVESGDTGVITPPDEGCGCRTSGGGAGALALVALLLLRRRR